MQVLDRQVKRRLTVEADGLETRLGSDRPDGGAREAYHHGLEGGCVLGGNLNQVSRVALGEQGQVRSAGIVVKRNRSRI